MKWIQRLVPLLLLSTLGCGASHIPPSLSPEGAAKYRANQVVVVFGTMQTAAIQLNAAEVCTPTCHPLLSEANTRTAVTVATDVISAARVAPAGALAVAKTGLARLEEHADAEGKQLLKAYVQAIRTVLAQIGE